MTNQYTKLFMKRRGYTDDYLNKINDFKHDKLKNIDKLSKILKTIHDNGDEIVVMPDFDTDGDSVAVVAYSALSELGFNCALYIPHPEDGYGIHVKDVKRVLKQFPKAKYLLTGDVGITAYDAFEYAYQHDLKVLLTDHHQEQKNKPKKLNCEVIVDPCQLNETYRLSGICGGYVIWQVFNNYVNQYASEFQKQQIYRLRVFAGIGTIGDMMPLLYENRQLLKDTVSFLKLIYNNGDNSVAKNIPGSVIYKRAFMGLFTLLDTFREYGKLKSINDLNEEFIGFYIAPCFNSFKRLEKPMVNLLGIFFADNKTQKTLAQNLMKINDERKVLVDEKIIELQDSIAKQEQKFAPYIFLSDAPGGVLGLIANKLKDKTNRPCFVINKFTLSGSGRSCPYFKAISELEDTEFMTAGHEMAFGISFENLDQVSRFYHYLTKNIEKRAKNYQPKEEFDLTLSYGTKIKYDGEISNQDCMEFASDLDKLAPFGKNFEKPEIKLILARNSFEIITMGKNNEHLKLHLSNGVDCIMWNGGNLSEKLTQASQISFTGEVSINQFRGENSPQFIGQILAVN